jgi:hypothetical protein
VRAAVWLAFESLPLFPCFYADSATQRGFDRRERKPYFYWPVWKEPVSLVVVKSLLCWKGLFSELELGEKSAVLAEEMRARGITAIYRSERFFLNKYYKSFRSPELVYSTGV